MTLRKILLALPLAAVGLLTVIPPASAETENKPGRRHIDVESGGTVCYCADFEENNCFCG